MKRTVLAWMLVVLIVLTSVVATRAAQDQDIGELIEALRDEDWRVRAAAARALGECHARLGQYPQAIECCQRVIELDPYREGAYRQKMRYHYYMGERGEALNVYEACVKVLKDELGVDPVSETCELYRQIRQREIPEPARAIPNNLPIPLTRFIGRGRHGQDSPGVTGGGRPDRAL
ncbi:MAG: bacterial transcriptional activator domain-containing protein [Candidatus Bipolaricaulia bacterium]